MATLDQIQIPNGTTYDLAAKAFYGTCSTAAATATKAVTLSSTVGWNLVAGVIIGVKFSNNNTASNVKLDVNGSGAKSIYFGNGVYTGAAVNITGWKDYIIYYMYDGTNWVFLNNSYNYADTNNYVAQTATTTSANYEVLFSNTADNTTRTEGARKNSNLIFNPSTGNLQTTQLNGVNIGSSPKFTDTTYSAGTGISLSGTAFSNSGVRSVATGSTNGTISVNTNGTAAEVAVKGLGSAAYTNSTAYAASSHTHNYAGSNTAGGAATTLLGTYSGSGGQLAPNTVASNSVKAVMMNNPKGLTGFNTYCDCILMDTYGGTDVPIVTGIGLSKKGTSSAADATPRAYIFNGIKGNTTTWANMAELITTKNVKTTSVGSASAGTAIAADDITAWSAGTLPTLGTAIAADDITAWSAGTLPTLGTAIAADDITAWSAGTAPSLTVTSVACDDITAWSAGSLPSLTYNSTNHTLTFAQGSLPSLSYTAKSVGSASGWSAGTVPSLSYTARSIPNVTGVGTLPSLTYTARSIPNVTGVGTLPSLTYTARSIPNISVTATTVATGGVN